MMHRYPARPRAIHPVRSLIFGFLGAALLLSPVNIHAQEPGGEVIELEELNVYASSLESAVIRKRESNTVGSFLDAGALADLPDDDLGEALSRLAGVNVIGGEGDAEASVTIRGADGQYNTVRINGALQANARLGSRNYDLNQIPTEMVASVEVLKSITAEHPADSIGGAVNVTTATAFSLDEMVQRYKLEYRYRELNDQSGWGANYVFGNVFDVGGGEDNLGVFLNFNYVDEDVTVWNAQLRYLDQANRLNRNDPNYESFARQTILEVNEDASIPIWDRFDPDERRINRDEFTFNASFDYKVSDNTVLFFRPWLQVTNSDRDLYAVRLDRIERAFAGGVWYFLDEAGNPLGDWVDADGNGVLGSAGDTFINAVDSNGELIVTQSYEANRDGRSYRSASDQASEATTWTFDLGGETILESGTLDYRVLYSTDDGDVLSREWRFEEYHDDGISGDYLRTRMIDGSTPFPEFIVFEVTQRRGHVPSNDRVNVFGDASRINSSASLYTLEDVHEDVMLAEINYEHRVSDNLDLKMGARYRSASRENKTKQLFFAPEAGLRRAYPVTEMGFDINAEGPMSLFDGRYSDTFGPYITAGPIFDFFLDEIQTNPGSFAFNRGDLRDAADTADLEETISAAYLQGTYRWKDLTIVAGVRYERTELDTTWKPSNFIVGTSDIPGLTAQDQANIDALIAAQLSELGFVGDPTQFVFGDIIDDINRTNDYDNVLPSVVASWRVANTGHVFRFAWTNTLTRPDYRELIPFDLAEANRALQEAGILDLTNRTEEYDIGNPDLTEQTSMNFDLAWEYYFGPDQRNSISVTAFTKELEDFLVEYVFQREIEVLIDPNDPSQGTEMVRNDASFWTNASSRSIQGIEFSGFINFGTLFPEWGFLNGFSIVPNYTYITGDQTDPIFDEDELAQGNFVVIGEEETDSLTNQAEHIVNLQFVYEFQRLSTRLSYNYISELQRTASTAAISARTFDVAQERWDLSMQYRVFADSDFRIFLEADNLTDTPQDERFIGKTAGLYTTSLNETGRRFVFGVRGSF